MPDHVVAADLDTLERLLDCLTDLRNEGQFSSLFFQAEQAWQMLSNMSEVSSSAHRARIGDLGSQYHSFMRSIAH